VKRIKHAKTSVRADTLRRGKAQKVAHDHKSERQRPPPRTLGFVMNGDGFNTSSMHVPVA
jgi:hypothetical protein